MTLEARHRPGDDAVLEALAQIARWPEAPTHWLVRYWPTSHGLRAVPVAVWLAGDDRPHSLSFSNIALAALPAVKPAAIHGMGHQSEPLDAALDQLLNVLESSVCQGVGRRTGQQRRRLQDCATLLARLGLDDGVTELEGLLSEQDAEQICRAVAGLVAWAMSLKEAWYLSQA
ncbi:MAG: hypothetical protein H0U74_02265 [Bradymonadaceae bacterium]|nr:hypothetical protein [Lujinxingiaceae bacterium]